MLQKLSRLFFQGKNLKKTIFKNIFYLAVGDGISRLIIFILYIYAAKVFGPSNFGIFTFAIAFASMFLIFSNFGLSDIMTRELAKNKDSEHDYPGVLLLRVALSIVAYALIFIASLFFIKDYFIREIIWILGVYVLTHNFLMIVYSFFRARQTMKYEAIIKIVEAVATAAAAVFILSIFPSIKNLSYVFSGTSLLIVATSLIVFSVTIKPVWLSLDFSLWKKFLKISWPLALSFAFGMVYVYIDSVMMGIFGQITQVGWYNAAYTLVSVFIIPSSLLSISFLPVLSKLFNESRERFRHMFKFYIKLTVVISAFIIIIGLVFGPHIINIVYGPAFSPAILAFQILTFMAALNFIYGPFCYTLIATDNQKKLFWVTAAGAVINIILNLVLIPSYSLYGAAIATLITYVVILLLSIQFSKHLFKNDF